jgi:hypothetical protein
LRNLGTVLESLALPPSLQPANSIRLTRTVHQTFAAQSDTAPRLLATLRPAVAPLLYSAWANIEPTPSPVRVYAARVKAALFASTFAGKPKLTQRPPLTEEGQPPERLSETETTTTFAPPSIANAWTGLVSASGRPSAVALDATYDQIKAGGWAAIYRPVVGSHDTVQDHKLTIHQVAEVQTASMNTETGFTAKVTLLTLNPPWLSDLNSDGLEISLNSPTVLRGTVVYAQTEQLDLAEEPLDRDVSGKTIELDGLFDGLESGRWIIVSGERTNIPGATGVTSSELVMIAAIEQGKENPSDAAHTTLVLANDLAYHYNSANVTVYGNVVKATHGQTVGEILGNGDASQAFEAFALHQSPLTYIPAPTPAGAASTLIVTVNDVKWHEADNLIMVGPTDRGYITKTNNAGQTSVIFGNGEHGARTPTGNANVKAVYRYGIGAAGNVGAGQISQLATHPLGPKSVTNPLPASGGADPDSRDQGRRNMPVAVMALDRLVSVQDYADLARTFAGIGKASAARLSDGRRQVVNITVAGVEDASIDPSSDLYRNLVLALRQFGDPYQPILVCVCKVKLLVICAGVKVLADYQWESVEPNVRAALLETFSFDARALGQTAFLSEAVSTLQGVEGVAYANVTTFDFVAEDISVDALSRLAGTLRLRAYVESKMAWVDMSVDLSTVADPTVQDLCRRIRPAELVFLTADIPGTLILTEITAASPGVAVAVAPSPTAKATHAGQRWRAAAPPRRAFPGATR